MDLPPAMMTSTSRISSVNSVYSSILWPKLKILKARSDRNRREGVDKLDHVCKENRKGETTRLYNQRSSAGESNHPSMEQCAGS